MIEVRHLTKSFGSICAINRLNFSIRQGEVVSLLGPNGAGKTTTMRILAGYFPPSSGEIRVGGSLYDGSRGLRKRIGYLPEGAPLYADMVAGDFLNFVADLKGVELRKRKNAVSSITALTGTEGILDRCVAGLSRGMRQRVCLAQALLGDPDFLILDEPTAGVDPKEAAEIRFLIRRLGAAKGIILSTHILPEASVVSDRVLILNEGRLVAAGRPEELAERLRHSRELCLTVRGNPDVLEEAFREIQAILAFRLERSENGEHHYKILYRKGTDAKPIVARRAVECNVELLELRESPVSLEEIFLKLIVREEDTEKGA